MAAGVLKGLRCVVDVHMSAGGADVDCSAEVGKKLSGLGARVVKRLGKETTHVIWLNGNRNVRDAALKRSDVFLVGPLWVEACAQTATRVAETKFFPAESSKGELKIKGRRASLMEPRKEDVFDEATPRKKRRESTEVVTPSYMRQPVSTQKKKLQLQQYKDSDDESAMDTVMEDMEPPAKRARVQPKINTWACAKCTFENPNTSQHCGICATVKSSTESSTTTTTDQSTDKSTQSSTPVPLKELKESIAKVTIKTKTNPVITKSTRQVSSSTSSTQAKSPLQKTTKVKPPIAKPPTPKAATERQKALRAKPTDSTSKQATPSTIPNKIDTKVSATKETIDTKKKAKAKPTKPTASSSTKNVKEITKPTTKATLSKTTSTKAASIATSTKAKAAPVKELRQVAPGKSDTRPKRFFIAISGADPATRQTLQSSIQAIDSQCPNQLSSRIVDANVAMTHVIVTDASKRTMKMLFGIARGSWIVTDSWVFSSLEAGKWLPEEDFQVEAYSHHQSQRVQLLKDIVFTISLTGKLEPPKDVIQSLITAAGGKVFPNPSRAKYCICNEPNRRAQLASVPCVTPKWLFDSIASNKLQEPELYLPGVTS